MLRFVEKKPFLKACFFPILDRNFPNQNAKRIALYFYLDNEINNLGLAQLACKIHIHLLNA